MDGTMISESQHHRFRQFKLVDGNRSCWRYELEVKLPFSPSWYSVHYDDQNSEPTEDIHDYLWAQACLGIARDVAKVQLALS